ncbi:MAG: Maf family protein [Rhodospirillales bacterium]|nr:Maf family protein [Rhodospirillales bacterium]
MIQNSNGLVLASASKARSRLLLGCGLSFTIDPANIDESIVKEKYKASGKTAGEAALRLAQEKAVAVSKKKPDMMVIGADQILYCQQNWFDKPGSPEGLREQLRTLRGKIHQLVCGLCVAYNGEVVWTHRDATQMTMRDFSDEFLDDYVESVGYLVEGSVGGYHLEGLGVQLFEKIEGDYFTILGLPLLPLLDFLRDQGILEK